MSVLTKDHHIKNRLDRQVGILSPPLFKKYLDMLIKLYLKSPFLYAGKWRDCMQQKNVNQHNFMSRTDD